MPNYDCDVLKLRIARELANSECSDCFFELASQASHQRRLRMRIASSHIVAPPKPIMVTLVRKQLATMSRIT